MSSYDIALGGLSAAQQAFNIIGNNIANAATEGYHKQRLNLTPAYSSQEGQSILGGGVNLGEVSRIIDVLLEKEIHGQQSSLASISQELDSLKTVETMFGELSSESGLNSSIDEFFNALKELAAHPSGIIYQEQVVSLADSMANRFQVLDEYLTKLENQITSEADSVIQEVNSLVESIAKMNGTIQKLEVSGGSSHNLSDQRDQCISKLSELVDIEIVAREHGVTDISVAGIPVVSGVSTNELDVGFDENGKLGVSVAGQENYFTDVDGGRLGGLFSLKNTIISDIHGKLNDLASEMISQFNQIHVQGIGSEGSFDDITSKAIVNGDLADFDPPVSDGNLYIRVTNLSTGQITRTAIPVDASSDSLSSLATLVSGVSGVSASYSDSRFHIQADTGYEFDFLPAVLPDPTDTDFTGATSPPDVAVSGIYSGTENQTLTFNVSGTGSIGNGTLQINVVDGNGITIKSLNVGSGYVAGDTLDIGNGIKIAIGTGDLVNGNSFEVDVYSQSDTSGLLSSIGINTFFSGKNASDISINSFISDNPGNIGTAIGSDMTDNKNVLRLVELQDTKLSNLDSMTFGEYYKRLVTDIGLDISTRTIREENIKASIQNLSNQQTELSGVNINDEAAQLLLFEQMFQGMAKYLGTLQNSITTLMQII